MIEYKVKVFEDGCEEWYLDGKCHREDGPAFVDARGFHQWYLDDEKLTEEEFNERMNPSPSCDGDVIVHNGKKYKLVLQK